MHATPPPRSQELLWGQPAPVGTGDLSSSLSGPAFSASPPSGDRGGKGRAEVGIIQMVTTRRSGEEGDGQEK